MPNTLSLTLEKEFSHTKVETVNESPGVAIVTATENYIPIEVFKETFNFIGSLVKSKGINKLVFDKSNLTVFHQPSMEWYFIEWKEEMFNFGLKTHRKILPNDNVFVQSVKIGRRTIENKFPEGKYKEMDIQYFDTVEEAVEK